MGRKIPGRKHKGIRDIDKQRQLKLKSIKDKINASPSNPDDQHVPKSLSHIIQLKEKVKSGEISVKRKRKRRKARGPVTSHPNGMRQRVNTPGKPEKPTPVFTQKEGESDKNFLWRVSRICDSVIKETAFENKYGVDIKRNEETGEVEGVTKRQKDELEVMVRLAKQAQSNKGKKKESDAETQEPKLTKSQKRQRKLTEKKRKKEGSRRSDGFENYRDDVKFGEVVHEPPSLSVPKKFSVKETPRPGKKNLLLKSIVENKGDVTVATRKLLNHDDGLKKTTNKVIDRTAKRKDLPHALRRQLERQQQEVVEAYKLLKSKKYGAK